MIRYIFLVATMVVVTILVILITVLPSPSVTSNVLKINRPAIQPKSQTDAQEDAHRQNNIIFTHVNIFDGGNVTSNQTLVVSQGNIASITNAADAKMSITQGYLTVDGSGLTLIPGIIDAHTHTYGNGLSDALRFGVTTHLDMFGTEETLSNTREARKALLPTSQADLYSAGTMATVEGGHGTQYGFKIDTIDSFDEIAKWVSLRKQAGSDYIKLVYMPYQHYMPSLNREFAKEVINQGHLQGMQVLAHISTHKAAQDMIEDGIDGLVHIFADKLASNELVALAKQNGVFIIPTLAVISAVDKRKLSQTLINNQDVSPFLSAQQKATLAADFGAKMPGFKYDIAQQNVKRFFDAGVPILSGSDAPNLGTAYGISALHEIVLLVAAGLSPQQALAAATKQPARLFSLSGRGVIAKGARADMLLIEGNPVTDITALYKIKSVYKNGFNINRQVDSQSLAGTALTTNILGDFTKSNAALDAFDSTDNFSWSMSDDGMANGKSMANMAIVNMAGANGDEKNGVLKVSASVNAGFPYPWAGAAVGDFTPPIQGKDLSTFTNIVFDVKGTKGVYRVMGFDTAAAGIPPAQSFTIGKQWQTITLPLSAFSGLNIKIVSGFAFVAGPTKGEFEFYLDNVRIE
jgi:imidazolonepropionase-like amidohydrolase